MAGIQKSLESIDDLAKIIIGLSEVLKDGGLSLKNLGKIFRLLGDLKELFDDGKNALPELKDLDAGEIAMLTQGGWVAIQKIWDAIKK